MQKSPAGRRRRPRQSNPNISTYRYATNSFVGDLLGNHHHTSKTKITMLQKTHKENYSLAVPGVETFLLQDSQNPFLLTRNVSDKLLQENDEDNFYNAIRMNYSSALKRKFKFHRPSVPRNKNNPIDNRHPHASKHLLATFYGRHVKREISDLSKLSDHLCFEDGDDKVYNYSMKPSRLLASSAAAAVHPLLRPSLLHFRYNYNNKPRPRSKGRTCHRRGSTTSCSTLSSFESFSSFTHPTDPENKRSSSVLGSSLRILMQTNHHQQVAPTHVSSAKLLFDTVILNLEERFRDMELAGNTTTTSEHGNTTNIQTNKNRKQQPPDKEKKTKNKQSKSTVEKTTTDYYNRSEASLDFCLLEKPKTNRHKRFSDHDDTPLSIFQPSVSSTQAESSSGIMFLFDSSNVPV